MGTIERNDLMGNGYKDIYYDLHIDHLRLIKRFEAAEKQIGKLERELEVERGRVKRAETKLDSQNYMHPQQVKQLRAELEDKDLIIAGLKSLLKEQTNE